MPIIEPWPSVGTNHHRESVRASKNLAYILQQVADADTVLYPVWESGITNPGKLANVLAASMAILFEGGDPSVYDATSFDGTKVCVIGALTIKAKEGDFTRSATGNENSDLDSYGDPYSNAEAQAFRRSCARWGLGLHLWG